MKFLTGLLLITCLSACNLAFPAATSSQSAATPSPMPPENNAAVPAGDCHVNIAQMMNVYDAPGNWGIITGRLAEGERHAVEEMSSNGWYRIGGVMAGWVAGNYALQEGDCSAVPRIESQPPLTACWVTNASGEVLTLRDSPQVIDTNFAGRFPINETLPVIRKEGDWYMVYVAAFSTGMWIQTSAVNSSPECAALP